MNLSRRVALGVVAALAASLLLAAQLALATTITWSAKTSMPTARTWISAAVQGGRLYVFGGLSSTTKLNTVERYDPALNAWEARAAMPTARYGSAAVSLNGLIYVIGGVNASNQISAIVEVYDPAQDAWSAAAAMPTARCRLAAVAGPDGKIYALGGSTSSTLDLTGYSAVVEAYDPGTNTWSVAAPLNTPRVGLAAAVSGGRIYAFGGYGQPLGYQARYLLSVESYDPATNIWSSATGMRIARYGLAAVATGNGLIYLIGGKNESSVLPSNNEEYNPTAASSSYVAGLLSGQRSELAAAAIANPQDVLYVVGGGNMWTPLANLDAGALSDLPSFTPSPTPLVYPPSPVSDLTAAPGCAAGSLLLSWTSPGGNGSSGTAYDYLVRYAASPITSQAAWDAATPVGAGIPAPLQAGTRQSMTVSGLTPGAPYYFSLRARNVQLQFAALSNSPTAAAGTGTAQKAWTVMIYAAADNNLDRYIHQDISSIELAAHNTCLNFVLYWDGLAQSDSAYYRLAFDPQMSTWAAYTQGVDKWAQGEANMGDPASLAAFAAWARSNYPAEHYALVIRDHGDGMGGMQEDYNPDDYLTIPELDQALETITAGGSQPLDLLFMDACLMGMLEDAYQFRGQAAIYVASEDVTWSSIRSNSHHDYFYAVRASTTPAELGAMIVNGYAGWMESRLVGYAYTLSAVDMSALTQVVSATNELAAGLDAGLATYGPQVQAARNASQRYYFRPYIDLADFAARIRAAISDAGIQASAQAVETAVENYVLAERHSTNNAGSHGVSIFFPSDSSSFYNPSSYDFAVGAAWPGGGLAPLEGDWGALLVHYITLYPGGPDVSTPPPPVAPQTPWELSLPLLWR